MTHKTKTGTVQRIDGPTARVRVDEERRHPLYEKQYPVSKSFVVHVPGAPEVSVGDTVLITETRPVSKRKRWALTQVLTRATLLEEIEEQ
ncbi:mitochondrial small ribosomal subunit protein uS17m [Candidatus Berkelbacteria bacterium]|nr:mitochondrial small ribosomal subunit protein uS17m [Candidatus Berkelbacteria bacterium]